MTVRPAKTQISLGIRPVCSESSLSACRKRGSLATQWAQAKTLIRLGGCPGWSESSLGTQSFCCFVMSRLIYRFNFMAVVRASNWTRPKSCCLILYVWSSVPGQTGFLLDHVILKFHNTKESCLHQVLFVFISYNYSLSYYSDSFENSTRCRNA